MSGRRRQQRRRRGGEDSDNLDRWLVSYADFITLLFAFFVLMYAISSVNEGKYRVLSESLSAIFNEEPRSIDPIQIGDTARTPETPIATTPDPLPDPRHNNQQQSKIVDLATSGESADQIARRLEVSLAPFAQDQQIEVSRKGDRIEVQINSQTLFESGDARLARAAFPLLEDVGRALRNVPHVIQVEGHTDNVPIRTRQYPSNWELSAARAASVVHFLGRTGIAPERLAAVGYGEYRPLDDNSKPEGRARNRRVTLAVLTSAGGEGVPVLGEPDDVPWAEGPALEQRR